MRWNDEDGADESNNNGHQTSTSYDFISKYV